LALKNICSIPRTWTLEDYRKHTCIDGSHGHVSRAELKPSIAKGLVVWLIEGQTRRESSVIYVLPDAHPGPATKRPCSPPINTGLSYAVGAELANAFYNREPYAAVMLANIRTKRESPAPEFAPEFYSNQI
jgi:hypothetical protein